MLLRAVFVSPSKFLLLNPRLYRLLHYDYQDFVHSLSSALRREESSKAKIYISLAITFSISRIIFMTCLSKSLYWFYWIHNCTVVSSSRLLGMVPLQTAVLIWLDAWTCSFMKSCWNHRFQLYSFCTTDMLACFLLLFHKPPNSYFMGQWCSV